MVKVKLLLLFFFSFFGGGVDKIKNINNDWDKLGLFEVATLNTEGHSWPPSTDCPHWVSERELLASHLQLARSLNLWHVLAVSANELKLQVPENSALLLHVIYFLKHGKSLNNPPPPTPAPNKYCLFFASLIFLDLGPPSDHLSFFWLWTWREKWRHSHRVSFCQTYGPERFNGLRLLVGWGCFVGREQVQ